MSININYNNKEINVIILQNFFKMLERRKIIKSWEKYLNDYKDSDLNIPIDIIFSNKTKYSLNIINTKIISIIQGSPLDEYLSNNIDIHKILIIRETNKKVVKQIANQFKNAEIFLETEMLEDIPDKSFIP